MISATFAAAIQIPIEAARSALMNPIRLRVWNPALARLDGHRTQQAGQPYQFIQVRFSMVMLGLMSRMPGKERMLAKITEPINKAANSISLPQ